MVKKIVLFLFCILGYSSGYSAKSDIRIHTTINRDWRFFQGDCEQQAAGEAYDVRTWERVGLPHSFSIPYFRTPDFYVGYGWYRKHLVIDQKWLEKRILLEFDGVFQVAEVYLNGKKVGEHTGGYTGFHIDVSDHVKAGENILAVRVNNLWNPAIAPRAGEHVFSGGIYRDVYLTVTDRLAFTCNGVGVTTPVVNQQEGVVAVQAEVINNYKEKRSFEVLAELTDMNGKKLAEAKTKYSMSAGSVENILLTFPKISNPRLWSPESPERYEVKLSIRERGKTLDRYTVFLGFRTLEWSADKGFSLNGKHYYLHGVNVHQDQAGWGDAVTQAAIRRDIQLMKDAGFNMIRGSHYPHHPYFAEVCDELGMFFLSENCLWGIGGFKQEGYWDSSTYPTNEKDIAGFEASAHQCLEEMIRINRNHPSILAWSLSNEPFFTASGTLEPVKKLLSSLVAHSKQSDPTRLVMIGGAQRGNIDKLGDIAGYNGDGATLFQNPGIPNVVCEYGSCVADRPGDYTPCWGELKDGQEPAWRSGHAIWCGFDHGSIAGDMGKMGIVDYFRIPKRSWYWYRKQLRGIDAPEWPQEGTPSALSLTADKLKIVGTDATDDVLLTVTVVDRENKPITSNPSVTFTIISGPGEFPTGRSITFHETTGDDIRILDGQSAIAFRSYEGGKSIIRATAEGLESSEITIETIGQPHYQEGITPIVADRTVKNYKRGKSVDPVKVSQARPTKASGVKKDMKTSYANDDDRMTCWESDLTGAPIWWQLDMENFYLVSSVKVWLTAGSQQTFRIEVSEDGTNWKYAGKSNDGRDVTVQAEKDTFGRFLRIVFDDTNKPAGLCEVEVMGKTK